MIIVDSREKGDFEEYEKKTLDLGDFHFYKNEKLILIAERKSVSDYCASMKDGRLHEQMFRLLNCGVKIVYIVEGDLSKNYGIDPESIKNSTINKIVHHSIPVIFTPNIEVTKKMLFYLDNSVQKMDEEKIANMSYIGCSKIKKNSSEKPLVRILTLISGVSASTAEAIAEKFSSLDNLINSLKNEGEKCLIGIELKERKIGEKLAIKIKNFLL